MTPERFQRMEALYDEAAALEPGERTRFIEEHCGGDEELRRELMARSAVRAPALRTWWRRRPLGPLTGKTSGPAAAWVRTGLCARSAAAEWARSTWPSGTTMSSTRKSR